MGQDYMLNLQGIKYNKCHFDARRQYQEARAQSIKWSEIFWKQIYIYIYIYIYSVQGICNTIVSSVFTKHNDSMYMNGKIKYDIL